MAELISIVYKPEDARQAEGAFTRVPVQECRLIQGYGIEGDAKGGNAFRQVNVMGVDSVSELGEAGYLTEPGRLGEQLVLSVPAIESLPVGTRLQIGDSAVLELLRLREPCDRFEAYQGRTRLGAVGRVGWMAAAAASGTIKVGDRVTVLAPEPAVAA